MRAGIPRPPQLLVAGVLLGVEAVAVFVFGVAEAGQVRSSRSVGLGVAVVMIGFGVALAVLARAVLRVRRWSRGPAVALQLILVPIAWSFRAAPTTLVAVVMAAMAAAVLVGLLHPRSTEALVPEATD